MIEAAMLVQMLAKLHHIWKLSIKMSSHSETEQQCFRKNVVETLLPETVSSNNVS